MVFSDFPNSEITIVTASGAVRSKVNAILTRDVVLIPGANVVVEPGDEIRRLLPNGSEEAFIVKDPQFHEGFDEIGPHYQVSVSRKVGHSAAVQQGNSGGHTIHVSGHNARVNIGSNDHSTNTVLTGDIFGNLSLAIKESEACDADKAALLAAVEEMKASQADKKSFAVAYQRFIASAADHITVITPFLPALAAIIAGH